MEIFNKEQIKLIICVLLLLCFNQGIFDLKNTGILYFFVFILSSLFLIILISEKKYKRILRFDLISGLLFCAILFYYYINTNVFYIFMVLKGLIALIIIYIIYLEVKDYPLRYKKIIVSILIVDTILIWLHTFYLLPDYPELSRGITGGWFQLMDNGSEFYCVALYAHCYAMPILSIYLLHCIIKYKKIQFFIIFILSLVCIYFGTFLISFIGLFIALVILLLMNLSKKIGTKKTIAYMLAFSLIMILASPYLLEYLINSGFVSYSLKIRLNEIYQLLFHGVLDYGDILSRLRVYNNSLSVILNNKLLPSQIANCSFGGHSTILDPIAITGFLSLLFFKSLYEITKTSMFKLDISLRVSIKVYLFIILLLNPTLLPQIFIFACILIPLFDDIMIEN